MPDDLGDLIVGFVLIGLVFLLFFIPYLIIHDLYWSYEKRLETVELANKIDPSDINKCIYDNMVQLGKTNYESIGKDPYERIVSKCANIPGRTSSEIIPMPIIISK